MIASDLKGKVIYLLIGIILLGVALRLIGLNFQSFWLDEIYSMNGSDPSKTVAEVIEYSKTDQPPLYFLLLHFWLKFFSFNDFYGRLLSAAIGITGIVAMFFVGREFKDIKTGLITSFLTAINYFHIYYSQEARFYSLLFLMSALSYLFFLLSIKRQKAIYFTGYVVFTTLVIYTHYYGLVAFASQGILFIFLMIYYKKPARLFVYVGTSAIIVMILISPWITILFRIARRNLFGLSFQSFISLFLISTTILKMCWEA